MPRRGRRRGGRQEGAGRPRKSYAEAQPRTIRDHVTPVFGQLEAITEPYEVIRDAFVRLTRRRVGPKSADLVLDCTSSEDRAKKIQKVLDKEPQKFASKEALAMLIHLRLSQYQYSQIAKLVHGIANNVILPAYDFVRRYKALCRPDGITVTEVKAEVDLQYLLAHTLDRLYEANMESIEAGVLQKTGRLSGSIRLAWGADSATGQRLYKQAFQLPENRDRTDNSLFAAVINPLEIVLDDGTLIWKNWTPQSPLLVRTFFLEFAKETKDYVTTFVSSIKESIQALQPLELTLLSGVVIEFKPQLFLTMVDGKLFSILTRTSCANCPVCNCGRNDFNNLNNIGRPRFGPINNGLDHNINPQHGWIRVLEHLRNVANNLPVYQEQALGDRAEELRNRRRAEIQAGFLRLGLIVGMPGQPGQGGSLDGNTSRRAFSNIQALAEILQLDPELIRRLWIILVCVNNTKYKLHEDRYLKYAIETYKLYVRLYRFYPMSPSVHKLLLHATEVQRNLGYPPGVLSESAGELWHKIRKQIRKESTRKTSRKVTMEDLIHRCLDQSDPVVSEIAREWIAHFRERKPDLPEEAINLLRVPRVNRDNDEQSSDDDDDDDGGENKQDDSNRTGEESNRRTGGNSNKGDGNPRPSKLQRLDLGDSDDEPGCSQQSHHYDDQIEVENGSDEIISELWEDDQNDPLTDLDSEEEVLYEYKEGD